MSLYFLSAFLYQPVSINARPAAAVRRYRHRLGRGGRRRWRWMLKSGRRVNVRVDVADVELRAAPGPGLYMWER
ncbi:uncharacterized protein F4812DRAFT_442939 [Daldinia caldariorum]|uniref:uncharacterized protein n=1 Tax=Daldinia caldariorum TaxID=326644 RepID=UPI0020079B2B|nr:uncharacterized protein F4812DRAFT_442939 [Daldinia caldariorum]KAI1464306.1 hypothetical protein F4812DRAFT_442939 [Daldinia caldariorum]